MHAIAIIDIPPSQYVELVRSHLFVGTACPPAPSSLIGFFYSSAEQREKLVAAEREVTDDRVRKIIELKKKVRGARPWRILDVKFIGA
jgi:hypothetical protein